MDRLLGTLSIFAGVLIVGTLLTTGFSQLDSAETLGSQFTMAGLGIQIDPVSLLAGIATGVALSQLARICWIEIPRRVTSWLSQNVSHIAYVCACAGLLALLIYS